MSVVSDYPGLFWDTNPSNIDPVQHSRYVIERVLEHGTWNAVKALFCDYPRGNIVEVICRSRRLSRRTCEFWKHCLNITEPIACLETRLPNPLSRLWE